MGRPVQHTSYPVLACITNVFMINVPTELMKLHSTGPLEAMATSTLRMDLQHAVCILSLY